MKKKSLFAPPASPEQALSTKPSADLNSGDLKLRRAFRKELSNWKPISPKELLDVKVGELWNEDARIMLEFECMGTSFFVVNNETDKAAVQRKAPGACVIDTINLIRIWTGVVDGEYLFKTMPKVLMAFKEFPGIKVDQVVSNA